jgi:hypothetical protein
MQIKTTLKFHLTPVRIKNTTNKCWQGCGLKKEPLYTASAITMENNMEMWGAE